MNTNTTELQFDFENWKEKALQWKAANPGVSFDPPKEQLDRQNHTKHKTKWVKKRNRKMSKQAIRQALKDNWRAQAGLKPRKTRKRPVLIIYGGFNTCK